MRVVVALGSNLGDRLGNLKAALAALADCGVRPGALSSVWETEPVPADQPKFLNAVVVGETDAEPPVLLERLKDLEQRLGRAPGGRWGPRAIDLDILFFGDGTFESEALTVPHPRIAERVFVLAPLSEVLPGPLPVLGEAAATLLARLDATGAHKTPHSLGTAKAG